MFTLPDQVYIYQDDAAHDDKSHLNEEEGDMKKESKESFMYFVRTGQFEVEVNTNFLDSIITKPEDQPKKSLLYQGDHFGEIGLIYNCRRTATVTSLNYGSLAKLTKTGFSEMSQQFPSMMTSFKQNIYKYKDELRTFLEMECDKIRFFRDLSMLTKQELLNNMERKTYFKDTMICSQGEIVDRMIVIQSGVIEVGTQYDKRREDELFVIERLGRGAILNAKAFVLKDMADTDFICRTNVSCFELTYDKLK